MVSDPGFPFVVTPYSMVKKKMWTDLTKNIN